METRASARSEARDARLCGLPLALACAAVALAAALVLALYAPLFHPARLHVQDMYVDQLGYITTARVLADTGELRNGVLMPSQIFNPRFHPYMPGHLYALAASYALFGWGVFQTLLPSLVAYVLAAAGTFLIGNRLYGPWSGALAAALFALFPADVAYAFTAMAELTFTLACVVALAVFAYLPETKRPWAVPFLLVLPFLFRETGALLVIPMALCVLRASGPRPALLAAAGSVASLWLVDRWQVATGKLAASLDWVTRGGFNYSDAFAGEPPALGTRGWIEALLANAQRNLGLLSDRLRHPPAGLVPAATLVIAALAAVALVSGFARRRDAFALGAGLMAALVLAMTVVLYDVQAHKLMRTAMFTLPAVAVAGAGTLRPEALAQRLRASARPRAIGALAAAVVLAPLAAGSYAVAHQAGRRMTRHDALTRRQSEQIAGLHDESKVIIAPPQVAPSYAVDHYPVRWCMPVADPETYLAVRERCDVGTVILDAQLTEAARRRMGLRLRTRLDTGHGEAFVYQPVPPSGEGLESPDGGASGGRR
jgi:Dolichyl-phosphate-mannose-protein mannosyltransferase